MEKQNGGSDKSSLNITILLYLIDSSILFEEASEIMCH